jgi:hypothetical protein
MVGAYHDAFCATFVMLVRAMSLMSKSRSKQTIEPPVFALRNEAENAAPCDVLRRHAASTRLSRSGHLPHEQ